MRDILFKNLTSQDHYKRDIFLSESFMHKGVMTKTQKHFIYFIRDHELLSKPEKLPVWLKKYAQKGPRLKSLSVLKTINSKIGEEKFEVKIVGNLLVLRNQDIFNVDFTQVFKINRHGDVLKEKKQ